MNMRTIKVRFRAEFEATIQVPETATASVIGDEISNINIPESNLCKYVPDTFEPITDNDGYPLIEKVDEESGEYPPRFCS